MIYIFLSWENMHRMTEFPVSITATFYFYIIVILYQHLFVKSEIRIHFCLSNLNYFLLNGLKLINLRVDNERTLMPYKFIFRYVSQELSHMLMILSRAFFIMFQVPPFNVLTSGNGGGFG